MKTADVQIGRAYLCRVGDTIKQVIVIACIPGHIRSSGRKSPDTFRVRRVGATTDLPSPRSATALRLCPETPPAKPCFICHEVNGHTAECHQLQYEPYADKAAKHLDPPEDLTTLPHEPTTERDVTIVAQSCYLDAAENKLGWCAHCARFIGENIRANAVNETCPECGNNMLHGAEYALMAGLIEPREGDVVGEYSTE
jgi:predicted RNA-binding Zn-ribbon protein involved in translation (DUF1610 family)